MAYRSALSNYDKITLTLDVAKLMDEHNPFHGLREKLEQLSITVNVKIPKDLYNDKGEIVTKLDVFIQTQKEIKITKQKRESSSGM